MNYEIVGSDILVISAIAKPYCGTSTKIPVTENRHGYDVVRVTDARLVDSGNYVY